jgi:ribosomal protein S18 acetylase RimI-like enzyme
MTDIACVIRPAVNEDIEAMVSLLKELFSIETDYVIDRDRQQGGLELLLAQPDSIVLVAEYNHSVIGMCSVQTVISTAEGGPAGLLEDMIVCRGFRRMGAGEMLLAAAEKWAGGHGLSRLQLLTDCRNESALSFYTSQGWQKTKMVCLQKILFQSTIDSFSK